MLSPFSKSLQFFTPYPIAFWGKIWYNNLVIEKSGCSAVGSALGSGPRGRAFKSPHSDQEKALKTSRFQGFSFLHNSLKNHL